MYYVNMLLCLPFSREKRVLWPNDLTLKKCLVRVSFICPRPTFPGTYCQFWKLGREVLYTEVSTQCTFLDVYMLRGESVLRGFFFLVILRGTWISTTTS